MKIIVDAMGGDLAPKEIVLGAADAAGTGVSVVLVGQKPVMEAILREEGIFLQDDALSLVHASDVIPMDAHAEELRGRKDASLTVAFALLRDGGGDALVSAGSTAAVLSGATLYPKRIRGVRRAALCPIIPTAMGGSLLIDCGANVECTAEYLVQFALMGQCYARLALGKENPSVGLLNIGAEPNKGGEVRVAAHALLTQKDAEGTLRFIGNIEGRDVLAGLCDVIVTDGFSGNILLKATEGAGLFFADFLKKTFRKNTMSKAAALLVRKNIVEFKRMMDYTEVGGAPFLGIAKPVIKAHGSSNRKAMKNAVLQAARYGASGTISQITALMQGTEQ